MPTYAIGDIHGHIDPLRDLLDQLEREVTADDTVVFLGDYVDRGPDTRGCVDAMLSWRDAVPARCVFLMGNHEHWMLTTMNDYTGHSWLLSAAGLSTVVSYSLEADQALRAAIDAAGPQLILGTVELPYGGFFDAMPDSHRQFFTSLDGFFDDEHALYTHAGVNLEDPDGRQIASLVWGDYDFPDLYTGTRTVVYGHKGDAVIDGSGWPLPRMSSNAIGIDSIKHGVLTAVRMPDRRVLQSRRYAALT